MSIESSIAFTRTIAPSLAHQQEARLGSSAPRIPNWKRLNHHPYVNGIFRQEEVDTVLDSARSFYRQEVEIGDFVIGPYVIPEQVDKFTNRMSHALRVETGVVETEGCDVVAHHRQNALARVLYAETVKSLKDKSIKPIPHAFLSENPTGTPIPEKADFYERLSHAIEASAQRPEVSTDGLTISDSEQFLNVVTEEWENSADVHNDLLGEQYNEWFTHVHGDLTEDKKNDSTGLATTYEHIRTNAAERIGRVKSIRPIAAALHAKTRVRYAIERTILADKRLSYDSSYNEDAMTEALREYENPDMVHFFMDELRVILRQQELEGTNITKEEVRAIWEQKGSLEAREAKYRTMAPILEKVFERWYSGLKPVTRDSRLKKLVISSSMKPMIEDLGAAEHDLAGIIGVTTVEPVQAADSDSTSKTKDQLLEELGSLYGTDPRLIQELKDNPNLTKNLIKSATMNAPFWITTRSLMGWPLVAANYQWLTNDGIADEFVGAHPVLSLSAATAAGVGAAVTKSLVQRLNFNNGRGSFEFLPTAVHTMSELGRSDRASSAKKGAAVGLASDLWFIVGPPTTAAAYAAGGVRGVMAIYGSIAASYTLEQLSMLFGGLVEKGKKSYENKREEMTYISKPD